MPLSIKPRVVTLTSLIMIIAIIIAMVVVNAKRPHQPPTLIGATLLPEGRAVGPFVLRDQHEQRFTEDLLRDKWTFVSMGFTHCPDICPLMLSTMRQVHDNIELAEDLTVEDTQFVFVSVDPRRDTPSVLNQFVSAFNPDFYGVTGSDEQIHRLANQLGLPYFTPDADSSDDYDVQHSGVIVLINPQGQYQAVFNYPQQSNEMTADFRAIVDYLS